MPRLRRIPLTCRPERREAPAERSRGPPCLPAVPEALRTFLPLTQRLQFDPPIGEGKSSPHSVSQPFVPARICSRPAIAPRVLRRWIQGRFVLDSTRSANYTRTVSPLPPSCAQRRQHLPLELRHRVRARAGRNLGLQCPVQPADRWHHAGQTAPVGQHVCFATVPAAPSWHIVPLRFRPRFPSTRHPRPLPELAQIDRQAQRRGKPQFGLARKDRNQQPGGKPTPAPAPMHKAPTFGPRCLFGRRRTGKRRILRGWRVPRRAHSHKLV